eukprot:TRINITY_DN233_c0_g1_i7.p1 TRINITY_DN233_c0_g1~~TRINITY_DN233_c0_g1_i7.p1  ORF type:complete len:1054 (+),score=7.43 TRINITY_DN233_c0_g1_i7:2756-5917(+)
MLGYVKILAEHEKTEVMEAIEIRRRGQIRHHDKATREPSLTLAKETRSVECRDLRMIIILRRIRSLEIVIAIVVHGSQEKLTLGGNIKQGRRKPDFVKSELKSKETSNPSEYDDHPEISAFHTSGFFRKGQRRFSSGLVMVSYLSPSSDLYSFHDFCLLVFSEYLDISKHNLVVNAVFKYTNVLGHYSHISVKKSDIELYGLEAILRAMLAGESDMTLYHGSDYVESLVSEEYEYYLSRSYFAFIYKPLTGGFASDSCSFRYCDALDVSRNANECFFECMSFLSPKCSNFNILRFRKKHGIPVTYGFPICLIQSYEALVGVRVCVVEDEVVVSRLGNETTFSPKVVYGDTSCGNVLLLKGDHYYVFWRLKTHQEILHLLEEEHGHAECPTPSEGKKAFTFFDYETVFDPHTSEALPYCVSYKNDEQIHVVLSTKPYQECEVIDSASRLLASRPRDDHCKRYLVGYNNSAFDNFLLLRSLMKSNEAISSVLVDSHNRLLYMRTSGCDVIDLYRFLLTPLSKACESFGCAKFKGSMDHLAVQESLFIKEENMTSYIEEKYLDIVQYSKSDVESLSELFHKVRDELFKLLGAFVEDYRTISSMSYKCFVRGLPKEIVLPIADEVVDAAVRRSIIGGRTQMFKPLEACSSCCNLDFVSLYPFVMMNRDYPLGTENPIFVKNYMQGFIGVYEVVVLSQPMLNIIPLRKDGDPLDWGFKGAISCWLTSVDYECLIRHSGKAEVKHGFVWKSKSSDLFTGFMRPIMEQKKTQDRHKESCNGEYNSCYRECLKLVLNSLSGKMIERTWKRKKIIVKTHLDIKRAEKSIDIDCYTPLQESPEYLVAEGEKRSTTIKTPSIIGSLIYSYAREWVYEQLLTRSETKYATDTDSLLLDYKEALEMKILHSDLFGTNEGQLVSESRHPFEAIFVSPKCYICFRKLVGHYGESYEFHRDGEYEILKPRWKGVRRGDKVVRDEKTRELIRAGRFSPEMLHNLYYKGTLDRALSVRVYRDMVIHPEKEVYILSNRMSRLDKEETRSPLALMNRYAIRKFVPKSDNMEAL